MTFHLLHLHAYPIYEQLLLEETLLRTSSDNWCILNEGSSPAVILGISGKKEELVDEKKASELHLPLIRRFSGGGTVVVDANTLFVSFICRKDLHPFPAYPEPILRWTEGFYKDVFTRADFALNEHDYVLGDKKCGGNAQYIKKERWLHHTSFLWDYSEEYMRSLRIPAKAPSYRKGRAHTDFLCRLNEIFPSKQAFFKRVIGALERRYLVIPAALPPSPFPDHPSTKFLL